MPGAFSLPVGVRTVRYMEYRTEETERSEEEMLYLAYERLALQMEGAVPSGMLLRKSIKETRTDTGFELFCRAEFLENIAQVKEIKIDGTENRKN